MTKYVLVGAGRSGTTWLGDLLRRHSQAACVMEPMGSDYEERVRHHQRYWADEDVWICPDASSDKDKQGVYSWIGNYFKEKVWTLQCQANGAKLLNFYFHRYSDLSHYLRPLADLQVIRINRNPIRVVVSYWYAHGLDNWNSETAAGVVPRQPSAIPRQFMDRQLQTYVKHQAAVEHAFRKHEVFEIEYRDLLRNHEDTFAGVCDHLGIRQELPVSDFQQMIQVPLETLVSNWEHLKMHTPDAFKKYWDMSMV